MPIADPRFLNSRNLAFTSSAETVPERLTRHTRTMEQGIYQVKDRFFVAVGYGNSNMTMIEGTDGVILIDSLETEEAALQAMADFRTISGKPVSAIIYTHSHPDHISGARALLDPVEVEGGNIDIYAHERLTSVIRGNPSLGIVPPTRLAYQFGLALDPGAEGLVEVGLGPLLHIGNNGFLPPTVQFQGTLDIEVAGVSMQLIEAPGESDDEIVVWFPRDHVLHGADVLQGETLPNLYALRGAVRDPMQWVRAIDLLRGLNAEALLLGHGRPMTGLDDVRELLTAARDAIQYIHDQSVRLMARGLTPDELVEAIPELPPRLRDHPWLGEFYGTVRQTVRQVYASNLGWFEGDPTFVDPLPRRERSIRYVDAMGGPAAIQRIASDAIAAEDHRWAAELLTHLLRVSPDDQAARQLKADALRQLGYQTSNPIWRNFYLTGAQELDGTLDQERLGLALRGLANQDVASSMPISLALRAFATRLAPEKSCGTCLTVEVQLRDTGDSYGIALRSDVAEDITGTPAEAHIVIQTTEETLRGLLTGRQNWTQARNSGAATMKTGSIEDIETFWAMFDQPSGELPAIVLR